MTPLLSDILFGIAGGLIVGYLPGAVAFRLPILERQKRGALAAEERAFWHVVISLVWSLSLVLAMAAAGVYRYEWLLAANLIVSVGLIGLARGGLRWRGTAAKITIAAMVPLVILGVGVWRFFPASEYVVGGKDPGAYVNEGIAIDRTGQLFRNDDVVPRVPEGSRDLFFRPYGAEHYYSLRFMGVFLKDASTGEVITQWPHLFPASIAIGYRLAGTRGATNMVALWATLGLLAVYFFGARLIGRLAAFFAAVVLALNLIELWFGRYPNAEVVMQALLFAALLALARGHQDDDPFFAWVSGVTGALMIFLRFDVFLALAGMSGALALAWIVQGRRPRLGFVVPIVGGTAIGMAYYAGPMRHYFHLYEVNLPAAPVIVGLVAAAAGAVLIIGRLRRYVAPVVSTYVPWVLGAVLLALSVYALFLRGKVGLLAEHDAFAFRTFRDAYFLWPALIASLAGCVMVTRREFWRDPAFFLVFAGFAIFFFYKVRVVPEQFWMARRFLPIVLPGALILASGAVFGSSTPEFRRTVRRGLAASAFMAFIGWQYVIAARPVAAHLEYKGAIRQVERLAQQFTPRDLVLVESRNAGSDFHTLAHPLAYQHGLQVLVLDSPRPDRRLFESFLADAVTKYDRVFFVGGGGTDLLSRRVQAAPIAFTPLKVPEYETTAWDTMPKGPREKDLGYSVFQLTLGDRARTLFDLDVGYLDDLNVVRFHAREVAEGRSIRWTGPQSFIAVTGITGAEREVEFIIHNGGRPAGAPPATLDVSFNETPLGQIRVEFGFKTYRLAIPADVVKLAATSEDPAQLKLVSSVWRPADFGGGGDTRQLGVMIDRVEIH